MDRETFLAVAKSGWTPFLSFLEAEEFWYRGMAVFRAEQIVFYSGLAALFQESGSFLDQVQEELELLKLSALARALQENRGRDLARNEEQLLRLWKSSRRMLYRNAFRLLRNKESAELLFDRYMDFFRDVTTPRRTSLLSVTRASSLIYRYGQKVGEGETLLGLPLLSVFLLSRWILQHGIHEFLVLMRSPLQIILLILMIAWYCWEIKSLRLLIFPIPPPPAPDAQLPEWKQGIRRDSIVDAVSLDASGVVASLKASSAEGRFLCWQAIDFVHQNGLRLFFKETPVNLDALEAECDLLCLVKLKGALKAGKALAASSSEDRVKNSLAWQNPRENWNSITSAYCAEEIGKALQANPLEIYDRYPGFFESSPFIPGLRLVRGE